jgi:hypothetical protein
MTVWPGRVSPALAGKSTGGSARPYAGHGRDAATTDAAWRA